MCGSCNCSPCYCNDECDASNEPLQSTVNNFIASFYGSVSKSCVNGVVVWSLPCNLDTAPFAGFPRIPGEGLACYFVRVLPQVGAVGPVGPPGPAGPPGPGGGSSILENQIFT